MAGNLVAGLDGPLLKFPAARLATHLIYEWLGERESAYNIE